MSPGTLVSLVQLHCMDLTRENGTCLGKNGPTRFEYSRLLEAHQFIVNLMNYSLTVFFTTGWSERRSHESSLSR